MAPNMAPKVKFQVIEISTLKGTLKFKLLKSKLGIPTVKSCTVRTSRFLRGLGRSLNSVAFELPSARLPETHRPRTPAPLGQPVEVARTVEAEPKIAS